MTFPSPTPDVAQLQETPGSGLTKDPAPLPCEPSRHTHQLSPLFEVLPPSLGPPPALLQEAVSSLSDMAPGTSFRYVLPDLSAERDPSKVTQVVLCSGKHYYALDKYRREQERTDVAIVRMEVSCWSLPPCACP